MSKSLNKYLDRIILSLFLQAERIEHRWCWPWRWIRLGAAVEQVGTVAMTRCHRVIKWTGLVESCDTRVLMSHTTTILMLFMTHAMGTPTHDCHSSLLLSFSCFDFYSRCLRFHNRVYIDNWIGHFAGTIHFHAFLLFITLLCYCPYLALILTLGVSVSFFVHIIDYHIEYFCW